MSRQERRKQERLEQKEARKKSAEAAKRFERDVKTKGIYDAHEAVKNPFYMQKVVNQRLDQHKNWDINGITKEDLNAEYEKGYAAARRDLTVFYAQMFYSAISISLHRMHKFGETRIERVLNDVKLIMTEEICTDDIRERCLRETGINIRCGDYDS